MTAARRSSASQLPRRCKANKPQEAQVKIMEEYRPKEEQRRHKTRSFISLVLIHIYIMPHPNPTFIPLKSIKSTYYDRITRLIIIINDNVMK